MSYKDDDETIQGLWRLGVSLIEPPIPTKITAPLLQEKPNLGVGSPGCAAAVEMRATFTWVNQQKLRHTRMSQDTIII